VFVAFRNFLTAFRAHAVESAFAKFSDKHSVYLS